MSLVQGRLLGITYAEGPEDPAWVLYTVHDDPDLGNAQWALCAGPNMLGLPSYAVDIHFYSDIRFVHGVMSDVDAIIAAPDKATRKAAIEAALANLPEIDPALRPIVEVVRCQVASTPSTSGGFPCMATQNTVIVRGPWYVKTEAAVAPNNDVLVKFFGKTTAQTTGVQARYAVPAAVGFPDIAEGPAVVVRRDYVAVSGTPTPRWVVHPAGAGGGGGAGGPAFAVYAPSTYAEAVAAGYTFA